MRYYMLNKPCGCVSAVTDERKKTVMDCFPEEMRAGLHPVGRLDYDTHGLLLVTDDGMVDQALLMPERHAKKKYFFYAVGRMDEEAKHLVESGVPLGQSGNISKPARLTVLNTFKIREIKEYLPELRRQRYLKNPDGDAFCAELEIYEGRKHEVKLMMRAVNCRVTYLKRTEFGGIRLDETLPEGCFRPLNENELEIVFGAENEIRRKKIAF